MQVRYYKALWGMDGALPEQLGMIRSAGYDGFETGIPQDGSAELRSVARDNGLRFIGMLFLEDVDALKRGIEAGVDLGAEKINVHAGKDWWTFQQGCMFFEGALDAIREAPVQVCFETHRGRLLFDPQSTAAYLRKFPDLRLCADFSHWTCVCESLLSDQAESVSLAIAQTGHLHARVGHEEGPQVGDPRAPEWQGHVDRFESWWDSILEAHRQRGEDLTVDPEFGPPNYMPTVPHTKAPVADLWDVCLYMRDRLKKRWA
jgi:sugar phosphate isomerase/epimerase